MTYDLIVGENIRQDVILYICAKEFDINKPKFERVGFSCHNNIPPKFKYYFAVQNKILQSIYENISMPSWTRDNFLIQHQTIIRNALKKIWIDAEIPKRYKFKIEKIKFLNIDIRKSPWFEKDEIKNMYFKLIFPNGFIQLCQEKNYFTYEEKYFLYLLLELNKSSGGKEFDQTVDELYVYARQFFEGEKDG